MCCACIFYVWYLLSKYHPSIKTIKSWFACIAVLPLAGETLTSKPRRSFSFQKQKWVTFLSQNSSGFTTQTSDTSAGMTFWNPTHIPPSLKTHIKATTRQSLEEGLTYFYLQHEDHRLHDVPLRPPAVHDHSETPSLTLVTGSGKQEFSFSKNSQKHFRLLWLAESCYLGMLSK